MVPSGMACARQVDSDQSLALLASAAFACDAFPTRCVEDYSRFTRVHCYTRLRGESRPAAYRAPYHEGVRHQNHGKRHGRQKGKCGAANTDDIQRKDRGDPSSGQIQNSSSFCLSVASWTSHALPSTLRYRASRIATTMQNIGAPDAVGHDTQKHKEERAHQEREFSVERHHPQTLPSHMRCSGKIGQRDT